MPARPPLPAFGSSPGQPPGDRGLARILGAALLAILLFTAGCAAPLHINRLSLNDTYAQLNQGALAGSTPSDFTQTILRRHGLLPLWKKDPNAAIANLRASVVHQPALWPELFALAELSYLQAKQSGSQEDFLAAALYAYAYLDPGGIADQPSPYDEHFRQAADIYNLGLTEAFSVAASAPAAIVSGPRALPSGEIELEVDSGQFQWHGHPLADFQPTINLSVSGLNNVYRTAGLGDPLAAKTHTPGNPTADQTESLQIAPGLRVPANLMLVIDDPRRQIAQPILQGRLLIHTLYEDPSMQIGQQTVPLEYNQSAAWAAGLVETAIWSRELSGFLNGTLFNQTQSQLTALEPHEVGRMPVILIHGTASSAFRWADMVNDLLQDPLIQQHFEFWFFSYSSGNPIAYSALQLRQAAEGAVAELGGVQADPALGQITLIGHSQGGLLAKMLVIDPGDRLWNGLGVPPLATLKVSPSSRQLLHDAFFSAPVPEVRRVIFIATPHRGSFLAGFSITGLIHRLVSLPVSITRLSAEILTGNANDATIRQMRRGLSSIRNMSPNSPFIKSLSAIPVAPGIHAHSIIPVSTSGPIAQGNDGVVAYSSAHIEGVDSELVVHSGHSTQSNPATIAEVERILLLQLRSAQYSPSRAAITP
jgi:pimeloyl-ACP methyl ester carboxylesterase